MKTLENYFDDWYHVGTEILEKTYTEKDSKIGDWLVSNIGIRGLEWDILLNQIREINPKRMRPPKRWTVFKFKKEKNAIMFILKWGGTLIQKNQ